LIKDKNIDTNALELLPIAVILYDNERIYFANKKAINIFKIPVSKQKNISKFSIFDFIISDLHDLVFKSNKLILNKKTLNPIEVKCINLKKEMLLIKAQSNCVLFNNNKVIQIVFTDISKKANDSEILQTIENNISEVNFECGFFPTPHVKYISESVYELLGKNAMEFYDNPNMFLELIHEEDRKKYLFSIENYLKLADSSKKSKGTFRFFHPNGNLLLLEISYKPKFLDGKISSILGSITDVSVDSLFKIDLEHKRINYQSILEASPIGIIIHKGHCLYCNPAAALILEEVNPNFFVGKYIVDYIVPEQQHIAIDRMSKAINGHIQENLSYKVITVKGNIIDVELKTVPFVYNGEICVQTIVTNLSIQKQLEKEKLRAEYAESLNEKLQNEIHIREEIQKQLIKQSTLYNTIFNNASNLIWTVDINFNIISFNKNYFDFLNKIYGINLNIKKQREELKNLKNYHFWIDKYQNVFNSKNHKFVDFFEAIDVDASGKRHFREVYLHPIRNFTDSITEIAVIAHDVTERRISEKKILDQSAKLKAIFESGDQLIWTVDKNFFVTSYNSNYFNLIKDKIVKENLENGLFVPVILTISSREKKRFWLDKYKQVFNGESQAFIHQSINDKKEIYREIFIEPIYLDNEVVEVSVMAQDITERILSENKIIQSLKEKEILLKEVHHRVKNNMQVISSILNLQSSYVSDPYALNLLKECQNRIKSMAYIHESLYQSKNFESIDFSEYVSLLAKNLVHTYSVGEKKIKLFLNLDNLSLNLDMAIPCGLIINEIISNSLKYAFPNAKDGIIFVTLKVNKKKICLELGDNGIGISSKLDIKNTKTLGLQLVETLIDQINGTFNLNRNNGTIFTINFNK